MHATCRPELHDSPSREQYDAFHSAMSDLGLLQTITRNGKVYRLPKGEYLGLNLSSSLHILSMKINAEAIRITGYPSKVSLTPVTDPDQICILGLEEDQSYAAGLSNFAVLSALGGLAAKPMESYPGFADISSRQTESYPALNALQRAMEDAVRPKQPGALLRNARFSSRRNG